MERRALFDNSSELVALVAGVFLVVVGLLTLVVMPWRYSGGGAVVDAFQILGSVATVAIGGGLAWLGAGRRRKKKSR